MNLNSYGMEKDIAIPVIATVLAGSLAVLVFVYGRYRDDRKRSQLGALYVAGKVFVAVALVAVLGSVVLGKLWPDTGEALPGGFEGAGEPSSSPSRSQDGSAGGAEPISSPLALPPGEVAALGDGFDLRGCGSGGHAGAVRWRPCVAEEGASLRFFVRLENGSDQEVRLRVKMDRHRAGTGFIDCQDGSWSGDGVHLAVPAGATVRTDARCWLEKTPYNHQTRAWVREASSGDWGGREMSANAHVGADGTVVYEG